MKNNNNLTKKKNVRVHCVSFGSDINYLQIANQTIQEVKNSFDIDQFHLFTANDLPSSILNYAKLRKRGFGYWLWKPFIVDSILKSLQYDDVLIYIDGRCNIGKNFSKKISSFLARDEYHLIAWSIDGCPEREWSSGDVFEKMDLNFESDEALSDQIAATFFVLKKNEHTEMLISQWLKFTEINKNILSDNKSKAPNYCGFIENRHDQSAFSMILKSKFINQNKIKAELIKSCDLDSVDFIIPHGKLAPHERKFIWAKWVTPRFLRPHLSRILNKIYFKY